MAANAGIVGLVILAILLAVGAIILVVYGFIDYQQKINSTQTGNTGPLLPCSKTVNKTTLVQIPSNKLPCIQNPSTYYIGNLPVPNDPTINYDFVVAPYSSTTPFEVCSGFCNSYTGGTCYGSDYNGKDSNSNFNDCINQLSSTTCTPPVPLAIRGNTLYYALSPTDKLCGPRISQGIG